MNATLMNCLKSYELVNPLAEDEAAQSASALSDSSGLHVYPRSITCARNAVFFLGRRGSDKSLGIVHSDSNPPGDYPLGFRSSQKTDLEGYSLTLCETTPENAA